MLIINRKATEWIQIGDDVRVHVQKTSRGSVRLAVDAPQGLRVLRGELVQDVVDEEPAARQPPAVSLVRRDTTPSRN